MIMLALFSMFMRVRLVFRFIGSLYFDCNIRWNNVLMSAILINFMFRCLKIVTMIMSMFMRMLIFVVVFMFVIVFTS